MAIEGKGTGARTATPRCVAITGAYSSGKTTLLESLLFVTGATKRRGTIADGNTVGDASPEARARNLSVDLSIAETRYLDDPWVFIDCPGSPEFSHEAMGPLMVADAAIVVCEPDPERVPNVAPLLAFLAKQGIPHMIFLNKLDETRETGAGLVRNTMEALQAASTRPMVLRQVPIRDGQDITGYVDVVSERAYRYTEGEPSKLISMPADVSEREQMARRELLESLADFDDALLEKLIEDVEPSSDEIYAHLTRDLQKNLVVPVFLGEAAKDGGVRRLLKALRHEVPTVETTAARRGVDAPEAGGAALQVFKTLHLPHTGKVSLARVWQGDLKDGASLDAHRVSGLFTLVGTNPEKLAVASPGTVVGLGRMDEVLTGMAFDGAGWHDAAGWPEPPKPVYAVALGVEKRADEVKLTSALQKLMEEDAALGIEHRPETNELLLHGQGDIHLQVARDRLRSRFNLGTETRRPQVPYRETIRNGTQQHARFKRQSGGHGQFADIKVEINPLPRGTGFAFTDKIVGGAIPRNYIPAVEEGVKDTLRRGPLGFPVEDVTVTLFDGQFHSVDSSDQAFRTAGRMAMQDGLGKCEPVLLEPICKVTVMVPTAFTSKAQRVLSSHRGQLLGFDASAVWPGWDEVEALMPEADVQNLIVELRSVSRGAATFTTSFDHLQELSGRLADAVVSERAAD